MFCVVDSAPTHGELLFALRITNDHRDCVDGARGGDKHPLVFNEHAAADWMAAISQNTGCEAAILIAVAGALDSCVEANPGAVVRDSRVDAKRGAALSTPGEARDTDKRY